ncbi:MAG: hypothetical protein H7842_07800 [Gammaproteobacteria bacterium SHHR-1]|uniref:hypothetical protein n=1 Tax=Magnetovirga frankeli TaxID=947516 RepID=UPI001292DE99|nr:hypothetical protein D5125_04805 [gamma proteobacterium SS-5]
MPLPLLFIALLTGLWLSGCQTLGVKDRQAQLEETLRVYSGTVRWGELADAYRFLSPELAQEQPPPEGLANIRVTRYEAADSPVINGDSAQVTARIRYIQQDRQVVQTLVDKQVWRFDPSSGWRRSNPIPVMQ